MTPLTRLDGDTSGGFSFEVNCQQRNETDLLYVFDFEFHRRSLTRLITGSLPGGGAIPIWDRAAGNNQPSTYRRPAIGNRVAAR
jgi:hypothetical protein